jgi:putative transposase
MARLPRLALADQAHLVALVGHGAQPVFVDDEDRRAFLAALREAALQHRVAVHAYVLLADHVHLLATPATDGALGALMQGLGRRYGAAFNRRHGRRGTLWAGRFRASVVQPGAPLLDAMLFIDHHAVRSALAEQAADHAWCSARQHLGLASDPLITECSAWWALGNTPFEREAAYRQLLAEGLAAPRAAALADAGRQGWPLGDTAFLAGLAQQTARPVQPRRRGRPTKARG